MLLFLLTQLSRRKIPPPSISAASHRLFSTSDTPSNLRSKYPFHPPSSLHQTPTKTRPESKPTKKPKPQYKPPSSLDRSGKNPVRATLPFDFRFSYTESSQVVRPIGLREPKYSPFGPDRVDRVWTGVCAPVVNPKVRSVDEEKVELNLEEKRKRTREKIQGVPLSNAERIALVERFQRHKTKRQINIGNVCVFVYVFMSVIAFR